MIELLYLYEKMSYYTCSEPTAPLPSMRNSVGVFFPRASADGVPWLPIAWMGFLENWEEGLLWRNWVIERQTNQKRSPIQSSAK